MHLNKVVLGIAFALLQSNAWAHVQYKNLLADNQNSLGQFQGTITNNYGWIDAADTAANDNLPLGDTHRVFWARFFIGQASNVAITVSAVSNLEGNSATYLSDLTPAFSLFAGLSPSLGHDGAHPACGANYGSTCHGVLDVLHDFTMYNSQGNSGDLTYIGHAVTSNGVSASTSFNNLAPGNYTVIIGGANANVLPNGTGMPLGTRAFTVNTSISAVPLPGAWTLFAGGLAVLSAHKRRQIR